MKHLAKLRLGIVGILSWLFLFSAASSGVAATGGSVTVTAAQAAPNPVASGDLATSALSAEAIPPSDPYVTYSGPSWSWSASGADGLAIDQPNPQLPAATLNATITTPGEYTLTVTATATWTASSGPSVSASNNASVTLTVVGVQTLQYLQPGESGGYVDAPATLYALVGKSITFKAIPTPETAAFPTGKPVWSGSSGATGTGDTKTVTFTTLSTSTSDFKTVTATCGNTSVTANVIVFDLIPIVTPRDNFEGRDLDAWGVCEFIDLSFLTVPSGISEYDIGGLQWQITSGGGDLSGATGGIDWYQCPDVAATIVLSLVVAGGPMLGEKKDADAVPADAPSGADVKQRPGTTLWHIKDVCSVGFCGDYYANHFKRVSFKEILVREGSCPSTATGCFLNPDGTSAAHMTSNWKALKDDSAGKDYYRMYQWDLDAQSRPYDQIGIGATPPGPGTFLWKIPNEYKKRGPANAPAHLYCKCWQECAADAAGKTTVKKGGSGEFAKDLADPTITPANWSQ